MGVDEDLVLRYLREHPELVYRLLSRRELESMGSQSFRDAVRYPESYFDRKELRQKVSEEINRERRELLRLAGLGSFILTTTFTLLYFSITLIDYYFI